MAELVIISKSIEDAERRYYLANGVYTEDLESLDVQLSPKPDLSWRIYPYDLHNVSGWMVQIYSGKLNIYLQRYFALPYDQCVSYNLRSDWLCKDLGGTLTTENPGHRIYKIAK